jgi:tetratricopeptide (TPR) repeat protein
LLAQRQTHAPILAVRVERCDNVRDSNVAKRGRENMRRYCRVLLCCLLAVCALPSAAVPDASGAATPAPAADITADAAMLARLNFNLGFEQFEKGQKLEISAGGQKGARARQAREEAMAAYSQARERLRTAVAAQVNLKEAWNLIGYTSRRLGDYEESLAAYEAALKLEPDYPEAIEYRAELFLLTGRLDEAKAAYQWLQQAAPSYAGVLLQSMRDWVDQAPTVAAVSKGDRELFAAWVGAQR